MRSVVRIPVFFLPAPDAQAVGDAVDVIEPGRDQCNLQDRQVVKTDSPQFVMVLRRQASRVPRQLNHVVQHRAIRLGQRGFRVILAQGGDQRVIQSDPTQKLCV
jgi:hypothetical protein